MVDSTARDTGAADKRTISMAQQLLMPKATAVWLVDNTALSFEQIATFCKLHPLEVKAIADGESAQGIKGLDPIATDSCRATRSPAPRQIRTTSSSFRSRSPCSRLQAQGPALHAGLQAPGSPECHSLAGSQPSRAEGRADFPPRRHHEVDDRADSRAHPLELDEPDADGSGNAWPVLADRSRP